MSKSLTFNIDGDNVTLSGNIKGEDLYKVYVVFSAVMAKNVGVGEVLDSFMEDVKRDACTILEERMKQEALLRNINSTGLN